MPKHDQSECAACRIVDTLTVHRDTAHAGSGSRRGTLNYAILVAKQECPAHRDAWAVDA